MASLKVSPPRIKDCIAHMECKVTLNREMWRPSSVLGEVLELSVRDDVIVDGLLDVEKIKPILHMGGKDFIVGDHRKKVY